MNTLVYTLITAFCIVVLASCMLLVEEKWQKCPDNQHAVAVELSNGKITSLCQAD